MSEDTQEVVVPSPSPTDPTPPQVPGPSPAQPEPVAPTVQAEPTPEQIEEARQFVVSKDYSYASATQIVKDYGALRILADKAAEAKGGGEAAQEVIDPSTPLPPGSVTVRVFDYDTRKSLHIMEQRDAGREFDVYVRTR